MEITFSQDRLKPEAEIGKCSPFALFRSVRRANSELIREDSCIPYRKPLIARQERPDKSSSNVMIFHSGKRTVPTNLTLWSNIRYKPPWI